MNRRTFVKTLPALTALAGTTSATAQETSDSKLQPIELLRPDVSRIAASVVRRLLVAVQNDEMQSSNGHPVITARHAPDPDHVVERVPIIDLVIAKHVQCVWMRRAKGVGEGLILGDGVGEVAQLYDGIGLF